MFDLIPNLISAVISIALPLHFAHKALRTSSPPLLAPWLMYFSILSVIHLFESYVPLLPWLPLYGTIRLFFLTWLVLPQTQGAIFLYQTYLSPWLLENEQKFDLWIGQAHERIRAAGGDAVARVIKWVKMQILGMKEEPPRPPPSNVENYASALLGRFAVSLPGFPAPQAAPQAQGTSDLAALLTSFTTTLGLSNAGAPSLQHQPLTPSPAARDAQIEALSQSGALIPSTLKSLGEKVDFVSAQRERLRVLLGALDREAGELEIQRDIERRVSQGPGGLSKSRSDASLEVLDVDEDDDEVEENQGKEEKAEQSSSGGWLGWWSGSAAGQGAKAPAKEGKEDKPVGKSTGVET